MTLLLAFILGIVMGLTVDHLWFILPLLVTAISAALDVSD